MITYLLASIIIFSICRIAKADLTSSLILAIAWPFYLFIFSIVVSFVLTLITAIFGITLGLLGIMIIGILLISIFG
jgi:hypothetical protein